MATTCSISINTTSTPINTIIGPVGGTFICNVTITPGGSFTPVFTITGINSASGSITSVFPKGLTIVSISFPRSVITTLGTNAGSMQVVFNSTPQASGFGLLSAGPTVVTSSTSTTVNCLHGASLISMREGTKRLDEIKEGDEVLSGLNLNEYAKVKDISYCWLSFMGTDHDAIIFEKDSLGPNQPFRKLIIDPGHPMCTQEEYLEEGYSKLRPAGSFWEELKESSHSQVSTKKWTDTFVKEKLSTRYDLVLEEPFNTYVANGVVVMSKGYKDHRYKEFV